MIHRLFLKRTAALGGLLLLATLAVSAQEQGLEDLPPELKDQAVVLGMIARIVEQNQEVVWDSSSSKATIPGRPVALKLVGTNIVVMAQFTLYIRNGGAKFLVAQGQVWIDNPGQGVGYHTTMQTIPMEYGEKIYFFPLGSANQENNHARIEIQLELRPYAETGGGGSDPSAAQSKGP